MTIKRILICKALVVLCLLGGVAAERGIGVADRVIPNLPKVDTTIVELSRISEFVSMSGLGEAPEFILNDLATDGLPLAEEVLVVLSESVLDANNADKQVLAILVDILGEPGDGKSVFLGNAVMSCIMFGVNYGRFVAIQEGVTAPDEVDKLVTTYGSAALEGLLVFLRGLPCPETETNSSEAAESDAAKQLDDWKGREPL